MTQILLTFDKSLAFFNPAIGSPEPIRVSGSRQASIKDIVESLGVPHTEVGTILLGRDEVDFSLVPSCGDVLSIKALRPPVDVTQASMLRPDPFDRLRFAADVNVGKLARYLLALGFDTTYSNSVSDSDLAETAGKERRVVLTTDTNLLKRRIITYGKRIRSPDPLDQLLEVLEHFGAGNGPFRFFSRCLDCNRKLEPVAKADIIHRLEPKTIRYFDTFTQCPECSAIFWKGSHYDAMVQRLRDLGLDGSATTTP